MRTQEGASMSITPLEPISGYGTLPHFINDGSAASRYADLKCY
jgi:hypothetical protein